jgi:hypothetical protein
MTDEAAPLLRVVALDTMGGGRGCVATVPIRAGQVIVMRRSADVLHRTSPHLAQITRQIAASRAPRDDNDDNDADDADAFPPFDEKFELAVILMLERALGSASQFAPYIAELPQEFACLPDEWDLDSVPLPPLTRALLAARRANVERVFRDSVLPWCARHAPPELAFSLAGFRWALNAVSSRAQWWNSNECPALVPLGDMINHATVPNAAFGAKLEVSMRLRSVGVAPSDELASASDIDEWFCAAMRDIAEGEQVFIEYSDDACDLFLNYGIAPAGPGGALFPLPTHRLAVPLVHASGAAAHLPDLLEEELEHHIIFVAHSPLGFQRAFDAFRLALAPSADPATFAAVRGGRPIASDSAAVDVIVKIAAQLLAETASLSRDDLRQRDCWLALTAFVQHKQL